MLIEDLQVIDKLFTGSKFVVEWIIIHGDSEKHGTLGFNVYKFLAVPHALYLFSTLLQ